MTVLMSASLALLVVGLAGSVVHRIQFHTASGLYALAMVLQGVAAIREGDHLWALFDAALCGYFAYGWWHGGGGDGTRRRLRGLARRFQGVRRTAPGGA